MSVFRPITLTKTLLLTVTLTLASFSASADQFWIVPDAVSSASRQSADIVYGSGYPKPTELTDEQEELFQPLTLITGKSVIELGQQNDYDNYHYSAGEKLEKGNYLICGTYEPTFWTDGDKGLQRTSKDTYEGTPSTSQQKIMFAKSILNIGYSEDTSVIAQPIGQKLEIIPQQNPLTLETNASLTVQVLLEGKPLADAEIKAFCDGKTTFSGKTDPQGQCAIPLPTSGLWSVNVENVQIPSAKPDMTDVQVLSSTLTFRTGTN